MATTFDWKIVELERETNDGYVYVAHYTISADDGVYSSGAYGSINFDRPEDDLIPFDSLTEELIIQWVKDKLTEEKVEEIEQALQNQLDEKHAPTRSAGTPWPKPNVSTPPQIVPPQV